MYPDNRIECLVGLFNDEEIWDSHKKLLISINNYAVSIGAPLLVVVIPHMSLDSHPYTTQKVVSFFNEIGVPVVDVAELVKNLPINDRVASLMDYHASVIVNKIIADDLYEKFIETGVIDKPKDR
jgi:hypothetical protein